MNFEASGPHPARVVDVRVGFSCHVFTNDPVKVAAPPELYAHSPEGRAFCHDRNQCSTKLRAIVEGLPIGKCFFTDRENFCRIHLDGWPAEVEYRVFFRVTRVDDEPNAVDVFVSSAYLAPRNGFAPRGAKRKPIGFRILVLKALLGETPVEPP